MAQASGAYERTFTFEHQAAFARLSGDYNPLHIDPLAARRLLFGRQVVHGIHGLLWALDCWAQPTGGPTQLHSLDAHFSRPIGLAEPLACLCTSDGISLAELSIEQAGSSLARFVIRFATRSEGPTDSHTQKPKASLPPREEPACRSRSEVSRDSGAVDLYLDAAEAGALFPNLLGVLPASQLAVLLATTRVVGMKCPGLHSVYSELHLKSDPTSRCPDLRYKVSGFKERFGLAMLDLEAPSIKGSLRAFVRPEPTLQPDFTTLCAQVPSGEFKDQHAVVIGGSRGLGEVVAKLLAAGGAQVVITYHTGKDDAERVATDIHLHRGQAAACALDVLHPQAGFDAIRAMPKAPTHLYYFATPFIFAGTKGPFSEDLHERFRAYYVFGFEKLVSGLQAAGISCVFYPSTVAINEQPDHMREYVLAKQEGEQACDFLEARLRGLKIYRPRLPRMLTDQTVSLMPVENLDPGVVMLKELRLFADRTRRA